MGRKPGRPKKTPVPVTSGGQDEVQYPEDFEIDVRRSSLAWRKLSRELLLLKCTKCSLEAKGSNKKLADRLDNRFKAIRNERESEQLDKNNNTTNDQATSQADANQLATQDLEQAWEPAQPAQPSVADLVVSVQNLTEIVISLTNAQTGKRKPAKKGEKRKRTPSISSESSFTSSWTSDTDSEHDSGPAQSAPSLASSKVTTSKSVKTSKDGGYRKHTRKSDKTSTTIERASLIKC